jgi:glycopeptide antibiotics resistance protein
MQTIKTEITKWFSSKRRIINLLIGLSAVVIYEVARATYRPFIYSNNINDFHIADTLGNSLGTVATVFVFASVLGRTITEDRFLLRTVAIAVFVYELAHPLLGKPIDVWDLMATVVGGVLCEIIYKWIHKPEN